MKGIEYLSVKGANGHSVAPLPIQMFSITSASLIRDYLDV